MGALIVRISMGRRIMKKLAFDYGLEELVGGLLSPGHRWHSVQRQKGPTAAVCPWQIRSLYGGVSKSRAASKSFEGFMYHFFLSDATT
jgi:hypothetical protein